MQLSKYHAGTTEAQREYRSFLPTRIHHSWRVDDPQVLTLLGRADRALGELNAFVQLVPNIDFFRRDAVAADCDPAPPLIYAAPESEVGDPIR